VAFLAALNGKTFEAPLPSSLEEVLKKLGNQGTIENAKE
jgi:hypothetical protein